MNLGGVGDLTLRGGVGDLGTGVEAGVDTGVGLFMNGVWGLEGAGVGVLAGGAGDFGGTGVTAGVAVLGCPSLGSGICSPCL